MKKRPMEDWDIIEKEKIVLKQGFRSMPEAEYELMEADNERVRQNAMVRTEKQ